MAGRKPISTTQAFTASSVSSPRCPRWAGGADDFKPGYRRHLYQAHRIFYTVEDDCVAIRAIYHTSLDLPEASD